MFIKLTTVWTQFSSVSIVYPELLLTKDPNILISRWRINNMIYFIILFFRRLLLNLKKKQKQKQKQNNKKTRKKLPGAISVNDIPLFCLFVIKGK
jgi:hypothetical protein